ncbi:hypothetical protein C0993_000847 [Termitomyces sp. T159_Od127]|nr:hypothetical protein C0993_000847 [Termitomyces sp. T159_Od127]
MHEDRTVLYAHDLPANISYLDIERAFRECNMIVTASIYREPSSSDQVPGLVALIEFMTAAEAEKAYATVQLCRIPSFVPESRLILSKTRLLAQSVSHAGRIIQHLPPGITDPELYDIIRPFGRVEYVEISQETEGILHFKDEAEAQKVESCVARLELLSYEPSKLICTHLSSEITKEALEALFEKLNVGPIVGVEVTTNNTGFVTYQTPLMALFAMENLDASVLGPSAEVSFQKAKDILPTMKSYRDILHALEIVTLERDDLRNAQTTAAQSVRRETQPELNALKPESDSQEKAVQDFRKERDDLAASLAAKSEYLEDLVERHIDQVTALERALKDRQREIQANKRQIESLRDDKNEANLKEATHLWENETWRKEKQDLERENMRLQDQILQLKEQESFPVGAVQCRVISSLNTDDPLKSPVSAPAPDDLLIETLLNKIGSLNTQLDKAKEDHCIEIEVMKGSIRTLELDKGNLKSALYATEKSLGDKITSQRARIVTLSAESLSMKEQYTSLDIQHALHSSSMNTQLNDIKEENEKLQERLVQVENDCENWRRKFHVVESRCKVLEMERDHPRWEDREKKGEAERAEQRRNVELKESKRRMHEMKEQERERERAKTKMRENQEAGRKEEDEKRDAELVKEQARQTAWKAATSAELYQCYLRDFRFICGRPWDHAIAFERFHLVMEDFEVRIFSEKKPLMLENIPWPTLYPIIYNPRSLVFGFRAEDITWAEVEKFFSYIATAYSVEYYNGLVERVHRMFHPDKWRSRRILNTVQDPDLRKSLESAGNTVVQAITPLWKKSKGRF